MDIRTSYEKRRGCGFRKPGGKYLVSGTRGRDCGRFPIPLVSCPTCHAGIHPSRGWTWIDSAPILWENDCRESGSCGHCPMALQANNGRVGLLWIGEQYYPTPDEFLREASTMGISRRISQVPREFEVGKTWVWFAHRKAIKNDDGTFTAGVFQAFQPERIEYVLKGTESSEELEALEKRGFTLVRVIPQHDEPLLNSESSHANGK